jgi:signal transduction histidine kinase
VELRRVLTPDAVVPLMAVVVVVGGSYYHDMATPRPFAVVLSVLACAALAARRRLPVATVALTAAPASAVFAVDRNMAPYALLAPATALFCLALCASRPRQVLGGVAAVVVTAAAQVLNPHPPGLLDDSQHVALLVVPVVAAEALRTRRDYRSLLTERLALLRLTREQDAQRRLQDERLRIARDLHDVIAHTLTTINVQASVAGHLLHTRPEQARHALSVIEEASRDGIGELRGILGVLRDPDGVASRAPAPGVDQVPELVEQARSAGLRAALEVTGDRPDRLPEAVSLAAYRIVQESLTNAARHSAAAGVQVSLSFAERELAIAVQNTATRRARHAQRSTPGPDLALVTPGVGILGMTERAQALGGTLTTTACDSGFLVRARLPYRAG